MNTSFINYLIMVNESRLTSSQEVMDSIRFLHN